MSFFSFSGLHETPDQKLEGHPMIELRGVNKSYQTASGDYPVLKGIDLVFQAGEFNSIIGKSGSGKTTLLNMITGIDRPTNGEIWVNGSALHKMSEGQMARWRGSNMGIVFQFFQLLPTLSILENLLLAMDFGGKIPPAERKERAMGLLNLVGLGEHAYKLPNALSGGQQQRVAIARALANDPPVLIADEPTGNLDSKTAESIFELFDNLARQGKTIIIVTHDGSLAKRTKRTTMIADGVMVNETIMRALPFLTPDQLMLVSQKSVNEVFSAGKQIFHQNSDNGDLFIVNSGVVEITTQQSLASDPIISRFGSGMIFGNLEMLPKEDHFVNAAAAKLSLVDVYRLDGQIVKELIGESEQTRQDIKDKIESWQKYKHSHARN